MTTLDEEKVAAMTAFPAELGGKRDLAYITPKGRKLSEYEAVSCYTQPSAHSGGLQWAGDLKLRPTGRPIFDPESTSIRCQDWFAYRDPNQTWQRPYYVAQSEAERSIERATDLALSSGFVSQIDPTWLEKGIRDAYLPLSHMEYGLYRTLNVAAREALSDTMTFVLAFNAADKLRHAQAICLLGLDLESGLPGFDATVARQSWLEDPAWQPARRLAESIMAIDDWCEMIVAVNLAAEPLLGEPLRHVVFSVLAGRHGDLISPVVAGTAMADWNRNRRWTGEFLRFVSGQPDGAENVALIERWSRDWGARVDEVASGLFDRLGAQLGEQALAGACREMAETQREFFAENPALV